MADRRTDAEPGARVRALEPGEVAWLAVLPCAVIVVLAIVLLGPPLGHALLAPGSDRFWPDAPIRPEPVEHARFLFALLGAPLAAGAVVASRRWRVHLSPRVARALIATAQCATVAFLAFALLAQHDVLVRSYIPPDSPEHLFTLRAIVAAALLALLLAAVLRRRAIVDRIAVLARETRSRRIACALVATLFVAVWLTAAFNTERSIGNAEANNLIPWDMSETFAVLDGRTPLVDFHSQYAQLLPYLAAGALRVVGTSVAAWTATLIVLSALALLAVYGVLRRVVRDSLLALALFLPFLAGSAQLIRGHLSPLEIFSLWPMRYGGPYLLAWLTARHIDAVAPRRRWLLLAVGVLVAINNLEFGLPALGGTLAALVYVAPPRSRRAAARLLADLGAGALAAVLVVSAISLAHGGALPRFSLLLEFPRIYGVGGWVLEPMATAGFHLAVYATFVAGIVVATVRAVRGDDGAVLTGMLVWGGVFGLGAGSYYAGRSDTLDLVSLFSAWCLVLMLLAVVVVRKLAGARRPTLPDLAVLFGCALAACAILQMPRPWAELARVRRTTAEVYKQPTAIDLVRRTAAPGEKVAILIPLGHRIAFDAGVVNVVPYAGSETMPTANQMDTTLAAMRAARVTRVYVDDAADQGQVDALEGDGYALSDSVGRYVMLATAPATP